MLKYSPQGSDFANCRLFQMNAKAYNFLRPRFILFTELLFLTYIGFCQCNSSDQIQNLSSESKGIINHYLEEVNVSSTLNRGILELKNYSKNAHPYFLLNEWSIGSIVYDEVFYPEILLKYDLIKEKLITKNSLGKIYWLSEDKVRNFELFDHAFLNINFEKSGESQILEVKHCGKVALYLEWEKEYKKVREYPLVREVFEEEQTYLLYKDGTYYKLKGRKSILKPLEDEKKAIKSFIKEEKLSAPENREHFFSKVTAYYNSIIENR